MLNLGLEELNSFPRGEVFSRKLHKDLIPGWGNGRRWTMIYTVTMVTAHNGRIAADPSHSPPSFHRCRIRAHILPTTPVTTNLCCWVNRLYMNQCTRCTRNFRGISYTSLYHLVSRHHYCCIRDGTRGGEDKRNSSKFKFCFLFLQGSCYIYNVLPRFSFCFLFNVTWHTGRRGQMKKFKI